METTTEVKVFDVKLKAKDAEKKEKTFPSDRALVLLKMKNSQWELADDGYKFDGKELSKATKEDNKPVK